MDNIAHYITSKLIDVNIVESRNEDWCAYLIEIWIMSLIGKIIIVIAGIANGYFIETIFFMASFIIMRRRTGGYHCRYSSNCIMLSFLIALSLPLGISILERLHIFIIGVIIIVCFLINQILAPINHPNMKMTKYELLANKRLARVDYVLLINCAFFIRFIRKTLCYSIIYGVLLVSISIIIAKILKQEVYFV